MNHHQIPSEVRIQKARTTLLLDHPFFGTLLFRLGGKALRSVATMATDGVSLFYNPEFVETLNAAELAGVLAHEVMHPALQHHTRRSDRDHARWNMACDYAINPMLLDAGLTLPKDVLIDNRFRGMSAERIYNLIEEDDSQEGSSGGSESQTGNGRCAPEDGSLQNDGARNDPQVPSTPGGVGQVLDAPEPEGESGPSVSEQAREWQIAVEQAETEKSLLEMHERIATSLRNSAAHTQNLDRIISNLHTLRDWLVEASSLVLDQGGESDSEKAQRRHDALTEINQAAMMGPYKITSEIHGWLVRTRDFLVTSPEELSKPRLHQATIAVRIATIDQALAVIEEHTVQPSDVAT